VDQAGTVVFAESSSYRTAPGALTPALGGTPPSYRHEGYAHVGWADGHVKRMRREALEMTGETEGGQRLGSGIDCFPYWNLR
jgi:prepilin-type processing-associated H-X9-DG protein